MSWTCPSCGRRYPDSAIGVPKKAHADQKTACEACDRIPNNGDPDERTVNNNTEGDAPDSLPVGCDICGDEAESRVAIAANQRDALVHWRGLCEDHLKELGVWWSEK